MRTQDFFALLLPSQGLRAIGVLSPGGMIHRWFQSFTEMADYALLPRSPEVAVYHACASFGAERRTAQNAVGARSFWLDMDVGETKPYATVKQAGAALHDFCAAIGAPLPFLVFSGNGLHAYWVMERPLRAATWIEYAGKIKSLCVQHGLQADPTRTGDIASILRPVGTRNNKNGKEVRAITEGVDLLDSVQFRAIIDAAYIPTDTTVKVYSAPSANRALGVNAAFGQMLPETPKYAGQVAKQCAQMRWIRDNQQEVDEPLWYAALGVLAHCVEPDQAAVEWSEQYAGYSESETLRKLEQASKASGPTTCEKFRSLRPDGCAGCSQAVRSPIILGQLEPQVLLREATVQAESEYPFVVPVGMPEKYVRFGDGAIGYINDDGPQRIASCEVIPVALEYLPTDLGRSYTVKIMIRVPRDGWHAVFVPMSTLGELSALRSVLYGAGVAELKDTAMSKYLGEYVAALQKSLDSTAQAAHLGWQPPVDLTDANSERPFVVGTQSYTSVGNTPVVYSKGAKEYAEHFRAVGSLENWKKTVAPMGESFPHAFGVLLGFMAPLMRLSGYSGATVVFVGPAGAGKTTILSVISSIYGVPEEIMFKEASTLNSLMALIQMHNALPVTIDEIGLMSPQKLSDVLMGVSSGSGKHRLNGRSELIHSGARWSTICIASANQTITTKLDLVEKDSNARRARLLEVHLRPSALVADGRMGEVALGVQKEFGTAGIPWVEYIVNHVPQLEEAIRASSKWIRKELQIEGNADLEGQSRFWIALVAMANVVMTATEKLGLFKVQDPEGLRQWMNNTVLAALGEAQESQINPQSVLSQYVTDRASQHVALQETKGEGRTRWTINGLNVGANGIVIRSENHGTGVISHTRRLIISEADFYKWCGERQYDSGNIRRQLLEKNALLRRTNYNMMSGVANPIALPQVPTTVWSIDTTVQGLRMTAAIAEIATSAASPEAVNGSD